MSATYYQPSGRVSIFGVIGGLVVGGLAAFVTAFVYAAALVYIPIVQIAFLIPFGFGALSGFITVAIARQFKLRNRFVALGLALATTSVAYFFSWVPWTYFTLSNLGVSDVGFLDVMNPLVLLEILGEIYVNGAWSIGSSGSAVSGVMLGICWVLEMLIVLGTACLVGYTQGSKGVFCEGCESWCAELPNLLRYTSAAEMELLRRLGLRDVAALGQMPGAAMGESPWVELKLSHCTNCGQTNTILLERCTLTRDHRGNAIIGRVPLVSHLLVRRDEVQWLQKIASR
jgi:hypothetical protein